MDQLLIPVIAGISAAFIASKIGEKGKLQKGGDKTDGFNSLPELIQALEGIIGKKGVKALQDNNRPVKYITYLNGRWTAFIAQNNGSGKNPNYNYDTVHNELLDHLRSNLNGLHDFHDFGGVSGLVLLDEDSHYLNLEPARQIVQGNAVLFSYTPANKVVAEADLMVKAGISAGFKGAIILLDKYNVFGKAATANALRPYVNRYFEDTCDVLTEGSNRNSHKSRERGSGPRLLEGLGGQKLMFVMTEDPALIKYSFGWENYVESGFFHKLSQAQYKEGWYNLPLLEAAKRKEEEEEN